MIIVALFNYGYVKADEYPEITDDIEIRYKWYKEIVSSEGEYYPLKDVTEEDKIDKNNIKYGPLRGIYTEENCSLPSEYYLIVPKYVGRYKKVYNASYVLIENVNYDNNIKIYYENKLVNFNIISTEENKIKIDLKKEYLCDKLLFFVDNATNYKITLYRDSSFQKEIISKNIENEKISVPDKTWTDENTVFYTDVITQKLVESDLTKLISAKIHCSYQEIYVYKYEVTREYYDDNYHVNVEGYIKDVNDYKFFYKGEPIVNTVEIEKEKIIKEPQIEYIYIEKENDSSQETECLPETITEIKTQVKKEIVEKEIFKIPIKIYIIIIMLILIIIFLSIKIFKKYVV